MVVKTAVSNETITKEIISLPEFSKLRQEQVLEVVEWARRKMDGGNGEEFFLSSIRLAEQDGNARNVRGGKVALEAFRMISGETPDKKEVRLILQNMEQLPTEKNEIVAQRPIYLWFDSKVEEAYRKEVINALNYILNLGGGPLGATPIVLRESDVADRCVGAAFVAKDGKVDENILVSKIYGATEGEKDHIKLFITSENIYGPSMGATNFLYGVAMGGGICLSYNRMKAWYEGKTLYDPLTGKMADAGPITFRAILIHELAHYFDAPNPKREGIQHIFGPHCPRTDCVLGQVNVTEYNRPSLFDETKNAIARIRKEGGGYLCKECEEDVIECQKGDYNDLEADFWEKKGSELYENGRLAEAADALHMHNEMKPGSFKNFHEAECLAQLGRLEEALAAYGRGFAGNTIEGKNFAGKARVLERLGRNDEAQEWYGKACNAFCKTGDRSLSDFSATKYEDAFSSYSKALEIKPDSATALLGKGKALVNMGRGAEAIEALEAAFKNGLEPEKFWYWKGVTLVGMQDNIGAISAFSEAARTNPADYDVFRARSTIRLSLEKFEDALEDANKCVEIEPSRSKGWYLKGKAHYRLGSREEALAALKEYADIILGREKSNSVYLDERTEVGQMLAELGDLDISLKICDDVLEWGLNAAALWTKGYVLYTQRDLAGALACFEKLNEIEPNGAETWMNRGVILKELGRENEAQECAARAKELGFEEEKPQE